MSHGLCGGRRRRRRARREWNHMRELSAHPHRRRRHPTLPWRAAPTAARRTAAVSTACASVRLRTRAPAAISARALVWSRRRWATRRSTTGRRWNAVGEAVAQHVRLLHLRCPAHSQRYVPSTPCLTRPCLARLQASACATTRHGEAMTATCT